MKKYFLLIMFAAIFTQDNIQNNNKQNQNPISLKGFKVGLDLGSDFEVSFEGSGQSDNLETALSLAMEFYTGNNFGIGIEFLNQADFDDWPGSVSHISFYGLFSFFNDDQMNLKAKFGYSTLDLDIGSSYYSSTIDSDGGIMYGLQLELINGIHVSYTIHNGDYNLDSYYYDYDYYDGNVPSINTKTSRLNISYLFNL